MCEWFRNPSLTECDCGSPTQSIPQFWCWYVPCTRWKSLKRPLIEQSRWPLITLQLIETWVPKEEFNGQCPGNESCLIFKKENLDL